MRIKLPALSRLGLALIAVTGACSDDDGPTGDRTPPSVAVLTPANSATAVARRTTISATFVEPIVPSSINASSFIVTGPGGTAVAGTISTTETSATFTPSAPLAYSTVYTAKLTEAVEDLAGNALPVTTWTFTTLPDAPPTVASTSPATGATGVAPTTAISATFSEPIDAASATTATFTVTPAGGSAVAGTVTTNGAVVTFTPTAALAFGTVYTAQLTTGIADVDGRTLATARTWTFTTAAAPAP